MKSDSPVDDQGGEGSSDASWWSRTWIYLVVGALTLVVVSTCDKTIRARSFTGAAWQSSDPNERREMVGDAGAWLDSAPTRAEVQDRLGSPNYYGTMCRGDCWDLGDTGGHAHHLAVTYDSDERVAEYEVVSH